MFLINERNMKINPKTKNLENYKNIVKNAMQINLSIEDASVIYETAHVKTNSLG